MRKSPGFGLLLLIGFSIAACCAANAEGPAITGLLVNGKVSNTGVVGAMLTIEGTGFGGTVGFSTAALNGLALAGAGATPVSWTNTRIVAVIQETMSSGPVIVRVNGKASNPVKFFIVPFITRVFPASASAGQGVNIDGQGFGTSVGSVSFNGVTASVDAWSDASILVTMPAGATAGPLDVTVSGLTSNSVPYPFAPPFFERLNNFNATGAVRPVDTPLVQGTDGYLYGTTFGGGAHGSGTVFQMGPLGDATILYSFCSLPGCPDGSRPYGGLVLGRDGNFYGTTSQGGAGDGTSGTIFRITPAGKLTTLHSFSATDGAGPNAPLILAANGMFYGLTQKGGPSNSGTFFRIAPAGSLTTLFNFSEATNLTGPLLQASDGSFYGTSQIGGAAHHGMIFKLTPNGGFSILHSFNSTDGSSPAGGLLQASDGSLYGTTYRGGSSTSCPSGCGTVFRITLAGALTTLHSFNSSDGANPIATLMQATDGNFYGTTYAGGTGGNLGTVFRITSAGVLTTLHSFQGTDGGHPYGPLSQDTNGQLYGTATNGTGTAARGTVFLCATGLSSFVSVVQNRGKAGQTVGILGQGLKGATSVLFGTTSAAFKIVSDNYLTATVPAGATTGLVTVTIPGQQLKSNLPFQVLP